jgi:hypothetical protein
MTLSGPLVVVLVFARMLAPQAKLCVQVNVSGFLGEADTSEPQAVWVVTSGAIANAGPDGWAWKFAGATGHTPAIHGAATKTMT